jgi:lysine biosynthesis protein LysW
MEGSSSKTKVGLSTATSEKPLPAARTERADASVQCVECDRKFVAKSFLENEIIPCPDCGTELECARNDSGNPMVHIAPKEREDWGE